MGLARAICAILLLCLASADARAHSQSYGYLNVTRTPEAASGQLALAWRDADMLLQLDADGDGRITWGEVKPREKEVAAALLAQVSLSEGGKPCRLSGSPLLTDMRGGEGYVVVPFSADCAAPGELLRIEYNLMFARDAQHRGLVSVASGGATENAVMAPGSNVFEAGNGGSGSSSFMTYVAHGAQA